MMKLLPLLLFLLNYELTIFCTLAEETILANSSTALETTNEGFPSEGTSQVNSTIQNSKGKNFDGGTPTELIPTNGTIEETTPQSLTILTLSRETSTTGLNSTRETSTEVITSNSSPEMSTSTTANDSIHESIKNVTFDPASKTIFSQKMSSGTTFAPKNFTQLSGTIHHCKSVEKNISESTLKTTFSQKSSTQITLAREKSVTNVSSTCESSTESISSQNPALQLTSTLKSSTSGSENSTDYSTRKIATLNYDKITKNVTTSSDSTLKTIFSQQTSIRTSLAHQKSIPNVTFYQDNSTNPISSQNSTLGLTLAPKLTTVTHENPTQLPAQKIGPCNQTSETIQTTRETPPTKKSSTSDTFTKPISNQNTTLITPASNQSRNTSIATTQIIAPYNTTRTLTNTTRSKKKKQKASKVTPQTVSRKPKTTFSRISYTYSKYSWTGSRTDPTFKEIDYRESNEFGEESFKKFMIRTELYVDKSLLIKEFLDHPAQVIVLVRPRYWGKSLNLNMLRKFFEIEVDHRGNILPQERQSNRPIFCGGHIYNESALKTFSSLKIANIPEAMEHQGKHPVIQLNYDFIRNGSFGEVEVGMKMEIIRSFKKHFYLKDYFKSNPDSLDDSDRSRFERYCNGNLTMEDLTHSIPFLSKLLFKYFNQTVFVLIDEYDAPLAEASRQSIKDPKNLEDILGFYRLMYESAFNNNPFLAKGFVTGKLRIENANLFNNVRNAAEYTLLDDQFSEFYGFTEPEVDELLKLAPNETAEEVKEFYRGYNYGSRVMYNPWSMKQCIEHKYKLATYWLRTGILLPAHRPRFSLEGFQQDIKTLLNGGSVQIAIKNEVTFNGLEDGRNFFNLVLFTGYLSPVGRNPNGTYQLVKPNKEANYFYKLLYGDWLQQHVRTFGLWGVTIPCDQNNTSVTSMNSSNATGVMEKCRFCSTSEDINSNHSLTTLYNSSELPFPQYSLKFTHNISQVFRKYDIVPRVIPVAPEKLARVLLSTGQELEPETVLGDDDIKHQPTVHWDADENSLYTLYLLTYQHAKNNTSKPDEGKRLTLSHQWHNWIVVNIPANQVSKGEVLYKYIPPRNTNTYDDIIHYVSFLVYKQTKGITKFEPQTKTRTELGDWLQYTPVIDFAANYSLGDPEFGNFFIMQFQW